jgi:hypothetical protein
MVQQLVQAQVFPPIYSTGSYRRFIRWKKASCFQTCLVARSSHSRHSRWMHCCGVVQQHILRSAILAAHVHRRTRRLAATMTCSQQLVTGKPVETNYIKHIHISAIYASKFNNPYMYAALHAPVRMLECWFPPKVESNRNYSQDEVNIGKCPSPLRRTEQGMTVFA